MHSACGNNSEILLYSMGPPLCKHFVVDPNIVREGESVHKIWDLLQVIKMMRCKWKLVDLSWQRLKVSEGYSKEHYIFLFTCIHIQHGNNKRIEAYTLGKWIQIQWKYIPQRKDGRETQCKPSINHETCSFILSREVRLFSVCPEDTGQKNDSCNDGLWALYCQHKSHSSHLKWDKR